MHPFDSLPDAALSALAEDCEARAFATGELVFAVGEDISSLYIIAEGEVEITDETDVQLSILGPRNSFGERALLRGEDATRTATVTAATTIMVLPAATLFGLIEAHATVAKFFQRRRPARSDGKDLSTMPVERLMTPEPVTCTPDTPIREAARQMQGRRISSICVSDAGRFSGIVTLRDMNARVIVEGSDPLGPVSSIMTKAPLTFGPKALVTDVLHLMVERRIGHIPIVDEMKLLGIVTKTDLTRAQALSSADVVGRVAKSADASEMARPTCWFNLSRRETGTKS